MRKSRLKGGQSTGWRQFLTILTVKAVSAAPPQEANAGQKTIGVNPQNTSQNCSNCVEKVPKKLPERTHYCANCSVIIDCDLNLAINIKNRGRAFRP